MQLINRKARNAYTILVGDHEGKKVGNKEVGKMVKLSLYQATEAHRFVRR
jgi:hypothetical protein